VNIKIGRFQFRLQLWPKVQYNSRKFKWWSVKVKGEGDTALSKGSPRGRWRKIIILQPLGAPNTTFSIGFSSAFGETRISTAQRKVVEGPFGMRMGPEDCWFFIASNKGEVELNLMRYVDIDELDLPLY